MADDNGKKDRENYLEVERKKKRRVEFNVHVQKIPSSSFHVFFFHKSLITAQVFFFS